MFRRAAAVRNSPGPTKDPLSSSLDQVHGFAFHLRSPTPPLSHAMNVLLKRLSTATVAITILNPPLLSAQEAKADPPLASGPAAGTKLTPVPCYATDGPLGGEEFDAAAKLRGSPGRPPLHPRTDPQHRSGPARPG